MSQRRELEQHLHALRETREIMNSMKSLALMETRKLLRFINAQQQVTRNIETMADDFRSHYPITPSIAEDAMQVVVLLGSERGFCGDFNNALLRQFDEQFDELKVKPEVITVGRKLCMKAEEEDRTVTPLTGASVTEEVGATLLNLIQTLSSVQQARGPLRLTVIHHTGESGEVEVTQVLPTFLQPPPVPRYSHPPRLNLEAERFFSSLVDEYLFATLHHLFYTSLMAENHRRMQHLEGALRRLDDQSAELALRRNVLRQEEITEEIEVILLSATTEQRPDLTPK